MDLEKAFAIGLFPKGFAGRIETAGNSSLAGCVKCLTDPSYAGRMEGIVENAREVDLAQNRRFQEHFVRSMEFG